MDESWATESLDPTNMDCSFLPGGATKANLFFVRLCRSGAFSHSRQGPLISPSSPDIYVCIRFVAFAASDKGEGAGSLILRPILAGEESDQALGLKV